MATTYSMVTLIPPELYRDNDGTCYSGSGSAGTLVDTVSIEVTGTGSTVALTVVPRSSGVNAPIENDTTVTRVPSTHGGAHAWSTSGTTTTLTFDVPGSGVEYGWDFDGTLTPTPLKIKVRVKRP